MILWRISNHADLNGLGGIGSEWLASTAASDGTSPVCRWPIFSESPALALLEVMVNFDLAPDELPADYQLLEVNMSKAPDPATEERDDCSAVGVLSLNNDQPGEQWEDSPAPWSHNRSASRSARCRQIVPLLFAGLRKTDRTGCAQVAGPARFWCGRDE